MLLGNGEANGIGNSFANTELYSYPFFRQLQQKNAVFSDVAAIFSMMDDVHGFVASESGQLGADSEMMHVALVSGSYFPLLGVPAQIGRTLNESDDTSEGNHPVVVVSHGFWERSLAGDPHVLDRKLKLGTTLFNIVGVAPPEFFGTKVGESPDMWVPLSMTKSVPPPGWDTYNKNFTHVAQPDWTVEARRDPCAGDGEREPAAEADYSRLFLTRSFLRRIWMNSTRATFRLRQWPMAFRRYAANSPSHCRS